MTRYAAFLRGVNLGKRQTRSADLLPVFQGLGFSEVRTLIASGNVLFEAAPAGGLRQRLEAALGERFGFSIGVVLRTMDQLGAMVASDPFGHVPEGADVALHVLLFGEPLLRPLPSLEGVEGDYQVARIDPTEIFFVLHRKPDGSYLGRSGLGEIDRLLPRGHLVTMRNWNTILKAAAL